MAEEDQKVQIRNPSRLYEIVSAESAVGKAINLTIKIPIDRMKSDLSPEVVEAITPGGFLVCFEGNKIIVYDPKTYNKNLPQNFHLYLAP